MISPRDYRHLPDPPRRWSAQYNSGRRADTNGGNSNSASDLHGAGLELELDGFVDAEREPAYDAVIVPLDGSEAAERALPVAASIASRMHAPLRLVHVASPRLHWDRGGFVLIDDRSHLRFLTHTEEYLQSVASRLIDIAGLDVTTKILHGHDVADALDHFCGSGNSLVVTIRSRRGTLSRLWNGSVTDDLAHRLHVPMLVLPHDEQPVRLGKRRILVPIGTQTPGPGLAEQLRPLGTMWDSEYWLVHAMPYRGFLKRIRRNRPAAEEFVHPGRDRAWAAIHETSAALQLEPSSVQARMIVDTSGPAKSILRHASLYRAQMIVLPMAPTASGWLPTRARTLESQVLWGSQVPVLICKPAR